MPSTERTQDCTTRLRSQIRPQTIVRLAKPEPSKSFSPERRLHLSSHAGSFYQLLKQSSEVSSFVLIRDVVTRSHRERKYRECRILTGAGREARAIGDENI